MSAEEVRSEVFAGVRMLSAAQLEECCEKLNLTVADNKKGIRKALENIVMRHLSSETLEEKEDEGLSDFLMLNDHIKSLMDPSANTGVQPPSAEVKTEDGEMKTKVGEPSAALSSVTTKVELHKLREFKINGGTVPDSVDFINLCNQMADGIDSGYTEKEVRNGVVRAMKPGTSLRRFFEGPLARKMSGKEFRDSLRSYYEQEDSDSLQEQLRKAVQREDQKEKDFLLDIIDLRDKLEVTSQAEGCPIRTQV